MIARGAYLVDGDVAKVGTAEANQARDIDDIWAQPQGLKHALRRLDGRSEERPKYPSTIQNGLQAFC